MIPAALLAFAVTAAACVLQLMPSGTAMLLVRVHDRAPASAPMAAARAGAAYVGSPAPGFAVVFGDAANIRSALGLAVRWKGQAPCSLTP